MSNPLKHRTATAESESLTSRPMVSSARRSEARTLADEFRRSALMALLAVCPLLGQTDNDDAPSEGADAAGGPQLFVQERTVDLGRFVEGDSAIGSFLLENRGDAELVIDSILIPNERSAQGPWSTLVERDVILQPGETWTLEVPYRTTGASSRKTMSVVVSSNDPVEPRMQLSLVAEMEPLFEVLMGKRPLGSTHWLGSIRRGARIREAIDVLPVKPGDALSVTDVLISSPALNHTIETITRGGRRGQRIKLLIDEDAPVGPMRSEIELHVTLGERSFRRFVEVSVNVLGRIQVQPATIQRFQPVRRGDSLGKLRVFSPSNIPFEIRKVDGGECLEAAVTRQASRNKKNANRRKGTSEYSVALRIKYDAPFGPSGTNVWIYTNSIEQPRIRVPVYATVTPDVIVEPPVVLLRLDQDIESRARRVKLYSFRYGDRLEITEVSTDFAYISVELADSHNDAENSLAHLAIRANERVPSGTHQGTVWVTTTSPAELKIAIPVTVVGSASPGASPKR